MNDNTAEPILRTSAFAGLLFIVVMLLAFMWRDLGRIRDCEADRTRTAKSTAVLEREWTRLKLALAVREGRDLRAGWFASRAPIRTPT